MSVTVKLRERDSGRLGFPLWGQSREGQGLPMGLSALGRGGRVPGIIPQAYMSCPCLCSARPGSWPGGSPTTSTPSFLAGINLLQPASCGPWAPCLGAACLPWGQGQQWGTPSHVPIEGASSPPGSLNQASGSCAVALRQLFLARRIPAWSRPFRPVPMDGWSSSPGPLLALCPLPTLFPSRVWVGMCRTP